MTRERQLGTTATLRKSNTTLHPKIALIGVVFVGAVFLSSVGICSGDAEVLLITSRQSVALKVKVARTPEEWSRGLEGVESLEEDEAFLYLFPRETIFTFSTRDVGFPIDAIFVDKTGHVESMQENVHGDRNHASPSPHLAILQTRTGFCEKNKVEKGNLIFSEDINLKPRERTSNLEEEAAAARRLLEKSARALPRDPDAQFELAMFHSGRKDYLEAEKAFRRSLDIKSDVRALVGLGDALAGQGKPQEAQEQFQKAVEMDPSHMQAYTRLVRMLLVAKNNTKVVEMLEEAVRTHPDILELRLHLARTYLSTGDLDDAQKVLAPVLDDLALGPDARRVLGDVHLRRGEMEKAAECYIEFLTVYPSAPHAAELRTFILVHKVKVEQSRASRKRDR